MFYLYLFVSNFVFFSKVPAFLNVVDIAGLVKGASEGQGLGNAFLSHIKACDAIFHLCRKSSNLVDDVQQKRNTVLTSLFRSIKV